MTLAEKIILPDALFIMDMSAKELADEAGLHLPTVVRAMMGGGRKTNIHSARRIAAVLNVKVDEIEWPAGLTIIGRPAGTGHPIEYRFEETSSEEGGFDFSESEEVDVDLPQPRLARRTYCPPRFCDDPTCKLVLPVASDICLCS